MAEAMNLGQGFPDWETPEFLQKYMKEAMKLSEHQYGRVGGHPMLTQAIAKEYGPKFNRKLDPMKEASSSIDLANF